MLILSRRTDESIIIDGCIEVEVVDIKGDQVKLGIRAPREIKVHRSEVYHAILNQNREAISASATLPKLNIPKLQETEK